MPEWVLCPVLRPLLLPGLMPLLLPGLWMRTRAAEWEGQKKVKGDAARGNIRR